MSATVLFPGSPDAPCAVALSSTSATDIYTATDSFVSLAATTIVNTTAGAITVTMNWNDGSTDYAFWHGSVAANTTVTAKYPAIKLRSGQKIKATGNTGITVFLTLSRTHGNVPAGG